MIYVSAIVSGALVGCLFAGVALGLSLVFGISNLLNLAHGGFLLIGAYAAWELQHSAGVHPFAAIPIVAVGAYGLGWLVYRVGGLARVSRGPLLMVVVFTFALDLVIVNAVTYHYGGVGRGLSVPQFMQRSWQAGDVVVPSGKLYVAIFAVLMTLALDWGIKRTKVGRGIRATRQDRGMAALNGVDVTATFARTFGIGAAAAAVAGILVALGSPIQPGIDVQYLVIAFAVAIIAGFGRIDAVVAGGLVYGVTLSVMSVWLGSGLGTAATFGCLFALLLVRPQGIFGSEYY